MSFLCKIGLHKLSEWRYSTMENKSTKFCNRYPKCHYYREKKGRP